MDTPAPAYGTTYSGTRWHLVPRPALRSSRCGVLMRTLHSRVPAGVEACSRCLNALDPWELAALGRLR